MIEIQNRDQVIKRLSKQDYVALNIIGILENTDNKGYWEEESGTVWVENGYMNYIIGDVSVIKDHLKSLPDGFYGFSGVKAELAEAIYPEFFLHWLEPTERYVFQKELSSQKSPYEITTITMHEAEGINDRYEYKNEDSLERIKEAIEHRPSSGIYIDNKLASYCLVHEDNSIGYMYTLEEHRHKGLGYWVTLDILKKMNQRNSVPFVEIAKWNDKSQGLATKTGFTKDYYIPWFGIIKGSPPEIKEWGENYETSKMFVTMAQIRYNVHLPSITKKVTLERLDQTIRYKLMDDANCFASILLKVEDDDQDDDTYIVSIESSMGYTIQDVLIGLAKHMPDKYAGFVLDFDALAARVLGCKLIT
jgi:hypothetical protein